VLAALAAWAGGRGAEGLYLQVERSNLAAIRLYAGAGFTEAAVYHYRCAPH
jgi:ribosomal protein S18 acetylase RimI-like enzyme